MQLEHAVGLGPEKEQPIPKGPAGQHVRIDEDALGHKTKLAEPSAFDAELFVPFAKCLERLLASLSQLQREGHDVLCLESRV